MDDVMDNIFGAEESELIEDETVENEQSEDEAEENTQSEPDSEKEQPEEGDAEDSREEQPEQLIDGRFKTADDLLKAYKSLQSEYTRLRQRPQQKETKAKQEENQEQDQDYEERLIEWYEATVITDPVKANSVLSRYIAEKEISKYKNQVEDQISPILEERSLGDKLAYAKDKYQDFKEYTQEIREEIKNISLEDPDMLEDPKIYEIAYYRAKSKALEQKMSKAFENGKNAGAQEVQNKKKIFNEKSNANNEGDEIPPGINIIPGGDGIFV